MAPAGHLTAAIVRPTRGRETGRRAQVKETRATGRLARVREIVRPVRDKAIAARGRLVRVVDGRPGKAVVIVRRVEVEAALVAVVEAAALAAEVVVVAVRPRAVDRSTNPQANARFDAR